MDTLNVQKPISPPLEVRHVQEESSSPLGRTATFSEVYHDTSIIFWKEYLQPCKIRNRTIVSSNGSVRSIKAPSVANGADQT